MKLPGECRREARQSLSGRWGKAILIFVALFFVNFALGIVSGVFEKIPVVGFVLSIVELVITIPLSYGIVYSYLKFYRGENIGAFDFITLGFNSFAKAWKVSLWTMVKMILPVILLVFSYFLLAAGMIFTSASVISGGTSFGFISVIGMILFVISMFWMVTRTLYYSLANFIAMDNENMTAKEAVEASQEMMRGNRGSLFLLQLSFIGWAILSIFTFGIGLLWLIPYMQLAIVAFYEKVRG